MLSEATQAQKNTADSGRCSILYAFKNNNQQNNAPGVQFPNVIMSADYSDNLARFKQIVNTQFMQKSQKNSIPLDANNKFFHS